MHLPFLVNFPWYNNCSLFFWLSKCGEIMLFGVVFIEKNCEVFTLNFSHSWSQEERRRQEWVVNLGSTPISEKWAVTRYSAGPTWMHTVGSTDIQSTTCSARGKQYCWQDGSSRQKINLLCKISKSSYILLFDHGLWALPSNPVSQKHKKQKNKMQHFWKYITSYLDNGSTLVNN